GRLAGIRQSDGAGVGDQLEAQPDGALLSGLPRIGMARRAIGRSLEVRVAIAAVAAAREHDPLTDLGEIGDLRLAVLLVNLSDDRNLHHDVGAACAVTV